MTLPHGIPPENFREVTPAEKAEIEKADAAWSRPPQALIDAWNEAWNVVTWFGGHVRYGQYNEDSGFFEGNGLTDITTEQARKILNCLPLAVITEDDSAGYVRFINYASPERYNCRTFVPIHCEYLREHSLKGLWGNAVTAEVVRWPTSNGLRYGNTKFALDGCSKLKTILGEITAPISSDTWSSLPKLENITIHARNGLDFSKSPLLSMESVRYMAGHLMKGQTSATVKLHANTCSAIPDDILELAAATGVTFISA